MRLVRLVLTVFLLVSLPSCITVKGDPKERSKAQASADPQPAKKSPSKSASTSPGPSERPDTGAPVTETSPSGVTPSPGRPAVSKTPSQTESARSDAPQLRPCEVLDQEVVRRVTLAFGDARVVASSAKVDQWTMFSCTYGTAPARQLEFSMTLDTTGEYEFWRLMVDSAKRAGNFSPFQGIGDKAFRGGEYDIAVRKGGLILAFSNTGKQLKPDTSKRLVASVLESLGQ